jgi:hypothetical protein
LDRNILYWLSPNETGELELVSWSAAQQYLSGPTTAIEGAVKLRLASGQQGLTRAVIKYIFGNPPHKIERLS